MIDLDELERLAKAASAKDALSFDEDTFSAYITPEIVCELINRLREAEKDAARYRYLRNTSDCDLNVVDGCGDLYMIDSLDKSIDAAIAKDKDNG